MLSEIKGMLGWIGVAMVCKCSMGNTCRWNWRRPGKSFVVDIMALLPWRGRMVLPGLGLSAAAAGSVLPIT